MVDPILKWAGGKRQLLDELYSRFPQEYNHYHEPMVGGGALFFNLEPDDGSINDTNPRLINFYKQVRDNPIELIDRVKEFDDPTSDPDPDTEFATHDRNGREIKNYYYQQRERFNKRPNDEPFDDLEEAALLLYLNRTCFNGLFRENGDGEFNVPIGGYTNPDWVRKQEIRAASEVLDNTSILNQDLDYVEDHAEPNDLVYFDPPYEPMSATAYFTDYRAEGFDKDDQQRLLDVAQHLDDNDVYVILSNSGIMYDMYDNAGFYVETEQATRSINSDSDNRDAVDEIIATNVPPGERASIGQTEIGEF